MAGISLTVITSNTSNPDYPMPTPQEPPGRTTSAQVRSIVKKIVIRHTIQRTRLMADNFAWTSAEDSNFVTELVDTIKPHFLNNRIPGPFPVVLKLLAHSSSCALVAGQPHPAEMHDSCREHMITIPMHDEIAPGTLNDILTREAHWKGLSKDERIQMLR